MSYGMNTRRKPIGQDWSIGSTVRVGFLQLRVIGKAQTGAWILESLAGDKHYEFHPYTGLYAI